MNEFDLISNNRVLRVLETSRLLILNIYGRDEKFISEPIVVVKDFSFFREALDLRSF